jgi:hypothetical protein
MPVSGSYQNYQNGAVSNQLTDVDKRELGFGSNSESADM